MSEPIKNKYTQETMKTPYIEQDCTITHEGREFTSGGAVVTDNYVVGYMSNDMTKITTWHGEIITGTAKVTSRWNTPHSFISSHMYQIRANINGRWYTGRTAGGGMIVRLKICK